MRNYYLTMLAMALCTLTGSCQDKKYETFKTEQNYKMKTLDSLLANYTTQPCYYAEISNSGCLYDVRINDVYTRTIWRPFASGGMALPINAKILKSGKQKISIKLYPQPGKTVITDPTPFTFRIGYKDFAQVSSADKARDWHLVLEMPQIVVPDEGLPYFEYQAEFIAEVPREIIGWSDCIDLRQIPDIEERVVAEFKRIREMMKKHKFNELEMLLAYKDYDLAKAFYDGSADIKDSWEEYRLGIESAAPEDWQEIEDYELVFYADGRLVTLESKKKDHYESALLRFRIKERHADHNVLTVNIYDMRLGIRQGTNELIPIR